MVKSKQLANRSLAQPMIFESEIRKGVDSLVRKSSEAVDALSRKLARDDKASSTSEATVSEAPTPGDVPPAAEEPEHHSTNGKAPQ